MNKNNFTCYQFDVEFGVFRRDDVTDFSYSDGDLVEDGLLKILSEAEDLSSMSEELEAQITDWPSRYHLSRARGNLLRPYRDIFTGSILEIGAGCGAITRYLGECGADVTAVEGSFRRAKVAAARTRDLGNVRVVCDRIQDFQADRKYDVVTLIGVLEYAQMFAPGSDAPHDLLRLAASFLRPGGKLVLAIENRLGLKYLAGMAEDHVNHGMYGLEGLYRPSEPITFGREELRALLNRSGFAEARFAYPFPDYKLPKSVVSDIGTELGSESFNAAAFAAESASEDPQLKLPALFSLELAWQSMGKNELLQDLANSFLVVASESKSLESINNNILAWHFSTSRRERFCKTTVFKTEAGNVVVERVNVDGAPINNAECYSGLRFAPIAEKYVVGESFRSEFAIILARPFWSIDDVVAYISRYMDFLISERRTGIDADERFGSMNTELSPEALDLLPHNLLVRDGHLVAVDEEWIASGGVELGYIVFRAIMYLLNGVTRCGYPQDFSLANFGNFVSAVFDKIWPGVTQELLDRYWNKEAELQLEVVGLKAGTYSSWAARSLPILDSSTTSVAAMIVEVNQLRAKLLQWSSAGNELAEFIFSRKGAVSGFAEDKPATEPVFFAELVRTDIASLVGIVDELHFSLATKEQSLNKALSDIEQITTEMDRLKLSHVEELAAREQYIGDLNLSLAERDRLLSLITGSMSWRLTKPLRWLRRKFGSRRAI